MTSSWQQAVAQCDRRGVPFVLATVLATSGSTPRNAGSKMVVSDAAVFDTIGGGQLEAMVVERGRELLGGTADAREITHFPLAAAALQCCGGSMTVLLEAYGVATMRLSIFGAGHVGRRVATLLRELSCHVELIDARAEQLDGVGSTAHCIRLDAPESHVGTLGARDHVLVMTHDHQLDYRILRALLRQPPTASLGLIGSRTKWSRFHRRLLDDGISADRLAAVRCPVGRSDIPGKEPMAVAIAIAAELLQLRGDVAAPSSAMGWRQIRYSLLPNDTVAATNCAPTPIRESMVT